MRSAHRQPYAVVCDRCNGYLFLDGNLLCPKCHGDGRILIVENAYTNRKALRHLFITGLVVLAIVWFIFKLKTL